jgi:hypothetical protein
VERGHIIVGNVGKRLNLHTPQHASHPLISSLLLPPQKTTVT